ncbi:protein Daple-like [Physella acuta]|uniref:protein Daple-like n=1 Tax=Physella acuta TaxID=109671 RepID=UPI0027DAFAF0|nr:protein Daple-like [Physella acuta]
MGCLDCNITYKADMVLVTQAHSTLLEHMDILTESKKLYHDNVVTGEKTTSETIEFGAKASNSDLISRLKNIETTISELQITDKKIDDNISELTEWRERSKLRQNDENLKIEKQNQTFENMKKQLNEQENTIKELNKKIKSFEEKEPGAKKALENMYLEIREHEMNLRDLNENMQVLTDKADMLTQEIKSRSDFQEHKSTESAISKVRQMLLKQIQEERKANIGNKVI